MFNVSDQPTCSLCANPKRDRQLVCVVEDVRDVIAIESTAQFTGLYHVLGGKISPLDGIGPQELRIDSLVKKVKEGTINEVILALSSTVEGDTTNYYIYKQISSYDVQITVLARGVSVGDELEYTDEVSLGRSIVKESHLMEQSKSIDLSVIIVSYNVEHFLHLCLESVYAAINNINAEIIVIDNASADNSVEMMRKKFPSTRVISNVDNLGFGKANNKAAKLAKGRYVCILNPDTIVSQKTFEEFIQFHGANPTIGISGPQMIDGTGQFLLESKRGLPTIKAAVFKSLGLFRLSARFFGQYYNLSLPQNQNGKTDVLAGAFMFMRKRLYDQLEGFDENFFHVWRGY